ncbi:hypothetical protein O4J56_12440 [Nocardiopsis sp. RSe5-2]|uniref:Lipoprotein n=1 Tax=Nocardiopsis endophytica TaxID=3018445 RepID=A0ABT4U3B1_9ACTN|nr:hypothetical protein [Nocardiopsis endophytica]MDA2811443.1 hypothetical protein [Nocardiopsis endophytica]
MRPRRPRPLAAVFAAAVAVLGAAAGCGADEELATARAAAGDLSASMLRAQAEDAFSRKGHPIAGRLECSADTGSDDADTVRLACTGMTRDEEQAEVSGRMGYAAVAGREDGDDGLPGRFVGRVGGDQVFVVTCFDCKPSPVVGKDGGGGSEADADKDTGKDAGKDAKKDTDEDAGSGGG